MPANSGSVFSQTLQEITNTKLEELSKKRSEFEATKAKILERLENENDPLKRLGLLNQGVKDCYGMKTTSDGTIISGPSNNTGLELELKHLDNFIAQATYDPSVTPELLRGWEESMLGHLDTQSSKLEYASLYAQLVTEWLSTERTAAGAVENDGGDIEMAEGFEDVGNSMKREARRGWEQVVFEPAKVDESALKAYLDNLFGLKDPSRPAKAKGLKDLREQLTKFENILAAPKQFDHATLTWAIRGLLASDLLTDERREVLRDFQSSPIILTEVADVLNLRLAALSSWSWGESVALEQQRKITGTLNIVMHEDVLQAIFLHYIGVKWSVFLKNAFRQFRKFDGAWPSSRRSIPEIDQKRREYYLGSRSLYRHHSLHSARHNIYHKHYFMTSLMGHDRQQQSSLEGEEEANYTVQNGPQVYQQQMYQQQQMQRQMPVQAPPMPVARQSAVAHRGRGAYHHAPVQAQPTGYSNAFGASAFGQPTPAVPPEFEQSDGDDEDRNPMEDKQRLIRLLSTEVAVNTKLHGEVTAFHSVFEGWYSLLPHQTVLIVMSLLGVSEMWVDFFTKFLRAPLKFLDDDPATQPRIRRRGTPASHVLSDVFGESILFCLDFAVNQATGGHALYRIREDFWFWSRDHSTAKSAWAAVSGFVNATKTYVDFKKSGTVRISRDPAVKLDIDESLPVGDIRWGFLKLSTQTGTFEIDQTLVDKHIVDLRRQLADKRKSVISFIQTWNTFAAMFFTTNFGKPANCFGRAHVDQILETHRRIQLEVFSSSPASPSPLLAGEATPSEPIVGVAEYIKHILRTRFGVSRIPDAYLFFPTELGGLDLRNPFISVLPVRGAVVPDPGALLDTFLEVERDNYERLKLAFERGDRVMTSLFGKVEGGWEPTNPSERAQFMAFEEYVRYREDINYDFDSGSNHHSLSGVYKRLLEAVPATSTESGTGIEVASAAVETGIKALAGASHSLKGIKHNWRDMDPYWRWVAQLYGPEAMRRFGGLDIVEPGLLPMGMVSIFREKRVKWQG